MRIAAVVIGAVIALSLLWGAGELHYQGCVNAAEARIADSPIRVRRAGDFAGTVYHDEAARQEAVKGCSRLPF